MDTDGEFAPETAAQARERFESVGSTAQLVVREVAKAMDFDGEEYDRRVTSDVVETAREALFADRLRVSVGSREEFEEWRDGTERAVQVFGSEHVDRVAWHAPPFADEAVAATFQDERRAAVDTLRRQAFAHLYRDVV